MNQSLGVAGEEDRGTALPEIPSASRGRDGENNKMTHSKRMASESNFAPVVVELRAAAAHSQKAVRTCSSDEAQEFDVIGGVEDVRSNTLN